MNSYMCSSGERVTKHILDRNTKKAKQLKAAEFENDHGYLFCEKCGKNSHSVLRIDPSHIISVKYAQETGRSELAWQIANIKYHCNECHEDHEAKTNQEREEIYIELNKS